MRPAVRALAIALSLAATGAHAHPHVFVEARLTLVVDETGAVTGVRQDWYYDDFFSLLLTADLGIDLDGDLSLMPDEVATLTNAVLDWPDGFEGDITLQTDRGPVDLQPRSEASAAYADGRVSESHLRVFEAPVPAGQTLRIRVFDPYYYVAYDLAPPVLVSPAEATAACDVTIEAADTGAARARVTALLDGRDPGSVGAEEAFPSVGGDFADTVVVTCRG